MTFLMVAAPDTHIASAYRANGIPVHLFIDKFGILRSVNPGGLSPDQMTTALTQISR